MIREQLKTHIENAIRAAQTSGDLPAFDVPAFGLTHPKEEMGDYACSIAMQLARVAKLAPPQVAQRIVAHLPTNAEFAAEVVGGYINLRLKSEFLASQIGTVRQANGSWGDINLGKKHKAQVEHGSANPTGYATIGTGRNVVVGDTLANTLDAAGYDVHREWYVNDAGTQVKVFGASLFFHYAQFLGVNETPPSGKFYEGEDAIEVAQSVARSHGDVFLKMADRTSAIQEIGKIGIERVMDNIRATMMRLGIRYDNFFSERSLRTSGLMDETFAMLRSKGLLIEHEGALWFSEDGSSIRSGQGIKKSDDEYANEEDAPDKDDKGKALPIQAVVVRSPKIVADPDERATYFASDIPYVWNKVKLRGFNPAVYVWGEDHQADVPRVLTAAKALGLPDNAARILIYRFITLMSGGKEVRMGKRKGNAILIDDVVNEIGVDAFRYVMLSRSIDTKFTVDLDMLKQQSDDNPVYYVQYAHARICSILRKIAESDAPKSQLAHPKYEHTSELSLIRKILELPEIVELIATQLQPHHYTTYARELAQAFSAFYRDCRVIGEAPDVMQSRIQLIEATKITLAKTLRLMGMSAPERM